MQRIHRGPYGYRDMFLQRRGDILDKTILTEYADMREEVKDLRRRIRNLESEISKLESSVVTDSVSCGKKGKKPIRTVKITGIPRGLITKKKIVLDARRARLVELESELLDLMNQAEEYIDAIKKSELRMMFRFYFIDDLTYIQTAAAMNSMFPKRKIKYTDENVKKRIQRFFQNVPQCPEKK